MKNIKIGDRFGRLVITSFKVSKKGKIKKVTTLCDCGNTRENFLFSLVKGNTKSCGCFRKERVTKHGCSNKRGKTLSTPEYSCWQSMKVRCYKKTYRDYHLYGGRGITVCDRWKKSFINFYNDMGIRPKGTTIDRIDTNGNYEPGNCKWSNIYEQAKNKRNIVWLTYQGKKMCLAEWSRILGINRDTIHDRIYKLGWSIDKALSKPPRTKNKYHE